MARSLTVSSVLGVAALLCVYHALPLMHAQTLSKVIPLQATFLESMFSEAGVLAMRKTRRYARFADHSTYVRIDEIFPTQAIKLIEILNVSANTWTDLDTVTHSTTTFKYAPAPSSVEDFLEGVSSESCADVDLSKSSRSDDLFGHRTIYVRDNPDSAWTRERWVAPDLNCLPLKQIDSLSGGARDEELAVELTVADPPDALLRVPFGYVERDPATVEELHKGARNGEVFWGPEVLLMREKDYLKNK